MRRNTLILLAVASLAGFPLQEAKAAIVLGTAGNFAVLAGTTVANTGFTTLTGDLGVSPGTSITGFETITLNGTVHQTDLVAAQAQQDLTTAYTAAATLPFTQDLSSTVLNGLTLTPGVYSFSSDANLIGTLTLNNQNNPNAQFVFQIGALLTAASGSTVIETNVGSMLPGSNVFWQVGDTATLETTAAFQGHILALNSINLRTGATILNGSALARNAQVTLQGNTITNSVVPEPATMALALFGGALSLMKRSRRDAR